MGEVAAVELRQFGHQAVEQHPGRRVVDLLGARDQLHVGLLERDVDRDVVSTTYDYDDADRSRINSTPEYSYDALGRTTSVPASQSPNGNTQTIRYYSNDKVCEYGGTTGQPCKFGIDPAGRYRTVLSVSSTIVNHYAGDSDSPEWEVDASNSSNWTRHIQGFGGAAGYASSASVGFYLVNLHGDIVGNFTAGTTATQPTATYESTEYGTPKAALPQQYGWLGAAQRRYDAQSGNILMGARSYNPSSGRFGSRDSIAGGSANTYDYGNADPVNQSDVTGASPVYGLKNICGVVVCTDYWTVQVSRNFGGKLAMQLGAGLALETVACGSLALFGPLGGVLALACGLAVAGWYADFVIQAVYASDHSRCLISRYIKGTSYWLGDWNTTDTNNWYCIRHNWDTHDPLYPAAPRFCWRNVGKVYGYTWDSGGYYLVCPTHDRYPT